MVQQERKSTNFNSFYDYLFPSEKEKIGQIIRIIVHTYIMVDINSLKE